MFNLFGGSSAKRLTAADAVAMAAKGEVTLLDVREAGEVAASGTAKGGVHIPLSMVPLKANPQGPDHDKRLDPAKPVAVFCAVGGRAGQAACARRAKASPSTRITVHSSINFAPMAL